MDTVIRKMIESDVSKVKEMMRVFYASDAVSTNGSDDIFNNDIKECVSDSPFAAGYVFEADGETAGYGMLAFGFSTEFGARCIWIEDIYVKEQYRGKGIGSRFIEYVKSIRDGRIIRLEAEKENVSAIKLYEKCGFGALPYLEMIIVYL